MSADSRTHLPAKANDSARQTPELINQQNDRAFTKPTMKIVLFKAPSHPGNKRSQSGLPDSKQKALLRASEANISANNTFSESVMLITALSNPLLYQRPALLPPLQRLIQALEVAHSIVEAYAAGDYLTENPVNVALGRVSLAWTDFISPLNAIHGLKAMSNAGPNIEARLNARKAVGQKLLALAKDKQSCVVASKYPGGPFTEPG